MPAFLLSWPFHLSLLSSSLICLGSLLLSPLLHSWVAVRAFLAKVLSSASSVFPQATASTSAPLQDLGTAAEVQPIGTAPHPVGLGMHFKVKQPHELCSSHIPDGETEAGQVRDLPLLTNTQGI